MNNFFGVSVRVLALNPAEAILGITIVPALVTAASEVRGRLMGPRCTYASTVEVAYPLRDWHQELNAATNTINKRVVIPEPNLWDPISPFLYEGPIELWSDGQLCAQATIRQGLHTLKLGPRGLHINGKPFTIRGATCHQPTEQDAHRLHQRGLNTLLAELDDDSATLWDRADRLGFLMIGRLVDQADLVRAQSLNAHPSCLGWLLAPPLWQQESLCSDALAKLQERGGPFVGIEVAEAPTQALPRDMSFLACSDALLPLVAAVRLPKLVLTTDRQSNGDTARQGVADSGDPKTTATKQGIRNKADVFTFILV